MGLKLCPPVTPKRHYNEVQQFWRRREKLEIQAKTLNQAENTGSYSPVLGKR